MEKEVQELYDESLNYLYSGNYDKSEESIFPKLFHSYYNL